MNYGLYTSASGMLTGMYRMDVQANNLANMETVGYKSDSPATRQRASAREEDGLGSLPSNELLERLGAGVLLAPNRVSQAQGSLQSTGNPLDVAITGQGYLVVRQGEGTGPESIRLSRDGRLTLNKEGRLVQSSTGLPVLDTSDQPITLPAARSNKVDIESNGWVKVAGERVAQIQLATVSDPTKLRKMGDNLMGGDQAMIAKRQEASGVLQQYHVERSTVDPVRTMLEISRAERAISSGAKMIQIHDELMSRAINTFGKVA